MKSLILILTSFIFFTSPGITGSIVFQDITDLPGSETNSGQPILTGSLEDLIAIEKDQIEDTLNQFSTISEQNALLEWKKFQKFENGLSDRNSSREYLAKTKEYIKDSLQILIVKLASIKTLEEKKLLQTDIKENPEYYLNLLSELKESELDPSAYLFYENKIRMVNQEILSRKYTISMIINFIAFSTVIGLIFTFLRWRKNTSHTLEYSLSKQEKRIKQLLLQGKTNKDIAEELFISPSTVKTHTSNIYSKLQVSGRKELLQN